MLKLVDDWEFNVLGVYNFRKPGPFSSLFNFVRDNHQRIEGDLVEAGVFRGSSLLGMALMLKELGSDKKIFGFDSFAGFPPVYHENDDLKRFEDLFRDGRISKEHIDAVRRNIEWRKAMSGVLMNSANISSSGDFSGTSLEFVRKKIETLGLDNIVLMDGVYSETMVASRVQPAKVMAALMDCDLYGSYIQTYEFVWPRLSSGGMIYLDEYYSLKFPGARMATDEFLQGKQARLEKAAQVVGDFERWYVVKD